MTDDIIRQLPRRPAPTEQGLTIVPVQRCHHRHFIIDDSLDRVECADCHEFLNPMWVLRHLAKEETVWHHSRKNYLEIMKKLKKRERTKCRHCGRMTPIRF